MLIVDNCLYFCFEISNAVLFFKFLIETKGPGLFGKMRETAGIHFH